MRWFAAGVASCAVFIAAFVIFGSRGSGIVLVTALGAVAVWWFGRCHHPSPLGLLPPTTDAEGVRHPAQWFCGACGASWVAEFDRDREPIRRFDGFDSTKAQHAARRADELERRQRALAVRRAGLDPVSSTQRPARPRVDRAPIVPIREAQRLAK